MKWFITSLPDTEQEREICLSYILNWILKVKVVETWVKFAWLLCGRSLHGCTVGEVCMAVLQAKVVGKVL